MVPAIPQLPADTPLLPVGQSSSVPQRLTVAKHDLTIYVEYPPLLETLLADIRAAQSRVWIEVYIFANDVGGTAVAEALKERARAGLDVRVLYDAVGSQLTPSAFFTDLEKAGVKVHCFHSLREALGHLRNFRVFSIINRRDHRKLIIIDDSIGYFGGMNLIDNTTPVPARRVPGSSAVTALTQSRSWRDVHVRLVGPQQCELAESFDRSWRRAHGLDVRRRPPSYRRALVLKTDPGLPGESIRFFDSGPGLKYSRAARVFYRLLYRARHTVVLSMAYFLPVGRVLHALLAARRRGVRIRIVTPREPDVPLIRRATSRLFSLLLKRGIRVYEREHQMLHAKVMVVDNTYTVVGSCNFDPRSLWINLEFLAVIRSPNLANMMAQICRDEIAQSRLLRPKDLLHTTFLDRVLNNLAWTVRWWL